MNITIKHEAGKKNASADALSRCTVNESGIAVVQGKEMIT
jgi:hypothetical protein